MSTPLSFTVPESGVSKPAIMRKTVVLPDPEGPSNVMNSPARMSRFTPSTALTVPKDLARLRISIKATEKPYSGARDL